MIRSLTLAHRDLGSNASRMASPSMMNASTVTARNVLGQISGHHAWRSRACAAKMSPPHEMLGARSPMPRNDSVASLAMKVPRVMVSTTTAGATALGAMCRTRIRPCPAPSIRAACT